MAAVSVRLPADLEASLDREARIAGRARSDVIREALGDYISRQERQRYMDAYIAEARAGYADPALLAEVQELAQDALVLDKDRDEPEGCNADVPWWR